MIEEPVVTGAEELPTMPEGEPKQPETPVAPEETDVTALIAELEKAGVTSTEQLQGKLVASKEAGNLSNQLGEVRKELSELKNLRAAEAPTYEAPELDIYGEQNTGTDLRKILREEIEAHDTRKVKEQFAAQEQVQAVWNEIQSDEDYSLVQSVWESKLQDPNFVRQIQQGQVNPIRAYNNVVRGYYKGIAKRSSDTIKQLQKGVVPSTPHVEGSGTANINIPENPNRAEEAKALLGKFGEKLDKGGLLTEQEELAAIQAALS